MLELIVVVAGCFLVALFFFGVAGWILFTLQTFDMDVLFSITACLLLGTIFLSTSVWVTNHSQLRDLWKVEAAKKTRKKQAAPQQPAQKPSS